MRCLLILLSIAWMAGALNAGEIVVYNQKWTGKKTGYFKEPTKGKGYLLIDFENKAFTRISTGTEFYSKIYRVETYTTPVFAEVGNSTSGILLAVQGHDKNTGSINNWERTVFFKGKNRLLGIGPSQKKQVPKLISGIRRMTQGSSILHQLEEDSFSATLNKAVTMDANGNSRTLDAQVELLTKSLEEAGFSRRGV